MVISFLHNLRLGGAGYSQQPLLGSLSLSQCTHLLLDMAEDKGRPMLHLVGDPLKSIKKLGRLRFDHAIKIPYPLKKQLGDLAPLPSTSLSLELRE